MGRISFKTAPTRDEKHGQIGGRDYAVSGDVRWLVERHPDWKTIRSIGITPASLPLPPSPLYEPLSQLTNAVAAIPSVIPIMSAWGRVIRKPPPAFKARQHIPHGLLFCPSCPDRVGAHHHLPVLVVRIRTSR